MAAGPGFPRAPPSTWTRRRTLRRRELAGDAGAAAVADLALAARVARPALATLTLAPVDDDLHVGVIRVVRDELVEELIGQLGRDDAVDHGKVRSGGGLEHAAVVGRGVGDLLVLGELGKLVALPRAAHASALVGQIDLVAVPA